MNSIELLFYIFILYRIFLYEKKYNSVADDAFYNNKNARHELHEKKF